LFVVAASSTVLPHRLYILWYIAKRRTAVQRQAAKAAPSYAVLQFDPTLSCGLDKIFGIGPNAYLGATAKMPQIT
jgi:hypothetical protein